MKTKLLAIATLFSCLVRSQTWFENFNSVPGGTIPVGWTQINFDSLTPLNNNLTLDNYPNMGNKAWISHKGNDFYDRGHGQVLCATSLYSPAGQANDWLITPSFSVPVNGRLIYEARRTKPWLNPQGYSIRISTNGMDTSDFATELDFVNNELNTFQAYEVDLSPYAGQQVYLAFINQSYNGSYIYVDNIGVISDYDGYVTDIKGLANYTTTNTPQTITATFRSLGTTPVTTAVLNYKVNNGAVVTQTFTFSSAIDYYSWPDEECVFSSQPNFITGLNKIKVWVSSTGNNTEITNSNDTAYSYVYVSSTFKPRNALIESFSSVYCSPCADINAFYDPLLNSNNVNTGGSLNVIKYQYNFPGNDASYNLCSSVRGSFYEIDGVGYMYANGRTEVVTHDQAEINSFIAPPAYADIQASLSVVGNNAVASATITPCITFTTNSPLRVYHALLQKHYFYDISGASQKDYYHVMRTMNNYGHGSPINAVSGVSLTSSFNHNINTVNMPVIGSYDFWTTSPEVYQYVVFVQDTVTHDILNSASASYTVGANGLAELNNDQMVSVYPNPANDFASIAVRLEQPSLVSLSVYDATGKLVYNKADTKVHAGKSEIKINTTEFPPGVYSIVLNTDVGLLTDKLIIVK